MTRNLLEVKSKAHTLAGILCNIKDMGEGVKESENSNSKITWCGVVILSNGLLFDLIKHVRY